MKLLSIFLVLVSITALYAVEPMSLLSYLATVVGVPKPIQQLIQFEMEVYGILKEDTANTTDIVKVELERETSTEAHAVGSSETGDFILTTEPEFDLLPGGYDQNFLEQIDKEDFEDDDEVMQDEPRFFGGGGCNDAFSAFAFLTFVLTLLDVILELQNQGRRKRELVPETDPSFLRQTEKNDSARNGSRDLNYREAVLASYSLFRGFSNALDAKDSEYSQVCAAKLLCEGWSEAASRGQTGLRLAQMSSFTAAFWLSKSLKETVDKDDLKEAMKLGIKIGKSKYHKSGENCSTQNPECKTNPGNYRFPGIKEPEVRNILDSKDLERRRQVAKSTIDNFYKLQNRILILKI